MTGYENGVNPVKRRIRLASRVLFKLVEMVYLSGGRLHGLKCDPWYVRHRPPQVNVTRICLMAMGFSLLVCNMPLETSPFYKTTHRDITPELYPNYWMNTPHTVTCFPGQRSHTWSQSGMPSKEIFWPLIPPPLHQIFVNWGRLFKGHGSVCLPNASSALSSPWCDELPPSVVRTKGGACYAIFVKYLQFNYFSVYFVNIYACIWE